MKTHPYAVILLMVPGLAWGGTAGTALPARLESAAKGALTDIAKAKTAIDAGQSKTSQSWLAKSQGLLQTVLNGAPGSSLVKKVDQASGAAQQGSAPASTSALSQAEQEAAKLDPSLAAKLGVANQKATQGDSGGAAGALAEAKDAVLQKTGLAGVESAYQKVTLARNLLKGGEGSKAKSLLDEIPTSVTGLLKGAGGL